MKNILVSLLVNPGDVIMMSAALDLIRARYPRARLDVLVRPEAAELVTGSPGLDEVIVYPYRSRSPWAGLGQLRRRIRAGSYDFFLSLDRRPRGAAAAFLAGIKERVGPDLLYEGSRRKFWTRLLFSRTVALSPEDCRGDQVEMFQQVARRAFNIGGQGRIQLPRPRAEHLERARSLTGAARGPVIGLCVKTNDPAKTWPAANYAALMARLKAELSAFLYVSGGPGDRVYAEELIGAAGREAALNLAGRTSWLDLAALGSLSDLYITPDNGAAHLMAHCGLEKMICLLISTTPEKVAGSLSQADFLSFPSPVRPDESQVDAVFEAVRRALAGAGGRRKA